MTGQNVRAGIPEFPSLPQITGVRIGAVPAGLRYQGRHDLMMAAFDEGTAAAGVFTKNQVVAAPVDWCRAHLNGGASDRIRGLVVNAGNANAMTGSRGERTARTTAETAAEHLGVEPEQVLLASTGVIGAIMAPGPIRRGLGRLAGGLSTALYRDAAQAIMTTDTFPKGVTRTVRVHGEEVTLNGIAKGSGMIEPDMATMLGFFFTDAAIPASLLRDLLVKVTGVSFNAITVDGDTSTNDCVLAFATGQAGCGSLPAMTGLDDPAYAEFVLAFTEAAQDLAQQIIRDGEGASKFVTVTVDGLATDEDAVAVAKTIANSPLVKTAFAGSDPNWGRIAAAAGRAGVAFDPAELSIWLGDHLVAHKGGLYTRYQEADAAAVMAEEDIQVRVSLGSGAGKATVWTSDLSHGYITINADYRS